MKEKVCMVVDLEGFFVKKKFQIRELGYYAWTGDHGRYAFYAKTPWHDLSVDDKRVVSYQKYNINGLTYEPMKEERGYESEEHEEVMKELYDKFKQGKRTVVAYKGGHVERDLLNKLNIPNVNLELYACPKYENLQSSIVEPLPSCGFHFNHKNAHCSMVECHAFWLWMITYVE